MNLNYNEIRWSKVFNESSKSIKIRFKSSELIRTIFKSSESNRTIFKSSELNNLNLSQVNKIKFKFKSS